MDDRVTIWLAAQLDYWDNEVDCLFYQDIAKSVCGYLKYWFVCNTLKLMVFYTFFCNVRLHECLIISNKILINLSSKPNFSYEVNPVLILKKNLPSNNEDKKPESPSPPTEGSHLSLHKFNERFN